MKATIINNGAADLLAWKCEEEDFAFGTRLVVKESQQAVFFRDGQALEVFGPGMHVLETGNLPFLQKLAKRFGKYFHCQVYYINHQIHREVRWGLSQRVTAMMELEPGKMAPLSIGAGGAMDIQVDPAQVTRFLTYLLGTGAALTRNDIWAQFQTMLNSFIQSHLTMALEQYQANVFTMNKYLPQINEILLEQLRPEFEEYGIILKKFYVKQLIMPEDDPIYCHAKLVYEKRYAATAQQELSQELEMKQREHKVRMASLEQQKKMIDAQTQAGVTATIAQGEAARRNLEGITSVQEHQFDTMKEMIHSGAFAPGTGGGSGMAGVGDMFGDVMKMSMGVQMFKEVGGVMKDTMGTAAQMTQGMTSVAAAPVPTPAPAPTPTQSETWTCECGQANPTNMNFCGMCGTRRPAPQPATWTCSCGQENPGNMNFCGMCGARKPAPAPMPWTCACGQENPATMNFCGACGARRG
ncbi:MAG: SPFH domain-containing protein [Lachnospiraceae bacterium]|nr:SPFH domain-containing protein [Lachnospiraceae bacterium]